MDVLIDVLGAMAVFVVIVLEKGAVVAAPGEDRGEKGQGSEGGDSEAHGGRVEVLW